MRNRLRFLKRLYTMKIREVEQNMFTKRKFIKFTKIDKKYYLSFYINFLNFLEVFIWDFRIILVTF